MLGGGDVYPTFTNLQRQLEPLVLIRRGSIRAQHWHARYGTTTHAKDVPSVSLRRTCSMSVGVRQHSFDESVQTNKLKMCSIPFVKVGICVPSLLSPSSTMRTRSWLIFVH